MATPYRYGTAAPTLSGSNQVRDTAAVRYAMPTRFRSAGFVRKQQVRRAAAVGHAVPAQLSARLHP